MNEKIQNLLERENLELANLGARFLAYLFDCFLVFFVCVLISWNDIALLFSEINTDSLSLVKKLLWQGFWLYVFLFLCYEVLLVSLYGATLGKMIVKIRIISVEFVDKPSVLRTFCRTIFKCLGALFLYVGFIIAFDERFRRALHDIVPKTLVIE